MTPKKFVVFAGDMYEPIGGWRDIQNSFESRDEADRAAREIIDSGNWKPDESSRCAEHGMPIMRIRRWFDWSQIVDLETGELTEYWMRDYYCPGCSERPTVEVGR